MSSACRNTRTIHDVIAESIARDDAVDAERIAQSNWEWEHGGKQQAARFIGRSVTFLSSSRHVGCAGQVIDATNKGRGRHNWRLTVRLSEASWRFGGAGVDENPNPGRSVQCGLTDVKFID